jgi:flagellar protein FlaH
MIFIEGPAGSGKSVLCQRLVYSFLLNGYTCSYLSTQFTVKNFVRQMNSVGYDIKRELLKGKLFFISTETTLGEAHPKETYLEKLYTAKKLFDPEIIVIDSISSLLNESLTEENYNDLIGFFNRWMGTGKIIIITANSEEWKTKLHQKFKLASDMHFDITLATVPGVGVSHQINIQKFTGAKYNYRTPTAFYVRPGVGMCIESTHVAF